MTLTFNYSGLYNELSLINKGFSGVTGDLFINAEFDIVETTNYIQDPDTGNYVPEDPVIVTLKGKIVQARIPAEVNIPGVNINRIYYEGYLVEPKTYDPLGLEVPTRILIRETWQDGKFDFIFTPTTPITQQSNSRESIGQKIRGFWVKNE